MSTVLGLKIIPNNTHPTTQTHTHEPHSMGTGANLEINGWWEGGGGLPESESDSASLGIGHITNVYCYGLCFFVVACGFVAFPDSQPFPVIET